MSQGKTSAVDRFRVKCLSPIQLPYITNTKVNSALHPSGAGKLSTGLSGWS